MAYDMSEKTKNHKESGLTLIELLVAIAILGIIAVLGWKGLDSIIFSQKELSEDVDDIRNIQLIFAQLQTDCAKISQPSRINGRSPVSISPDSLTITRDAYSSAGIPGIQLIRYYLEDGKLYRSASEPTRLIKNLHLHWLADKAAINESQILLHEKVDTIKIRLWNKVSQRWQSYVDIQANKVETTNGTTFDASQLYNYRYTGLALDIRLTNSQSDITKVVFLGPS